MYINKCEQKIKKQKYYPDKNCIQKCKTKQTVKIDNFFCHYYNFFLTEHKKMMNMQSTRLYERNSSRQHRMVDIEYENIDQQIQRVRQQLALIQKQEKSKSKKSKQDIQSKKIKPNQQIEQIYIQEQESSEKYLNKQTPQKELKSSKVQFNKLNQQMVYTIINNLDRIYELFKEKCPVYSKIDVIKALYIKYIGPQPIQLPKKPNKIIKNKQVGEQAKGKNKIQQKSKYMDKKRLQTNATRRYPLLKSSQLPMQSSQPVKRSQVRPLTGYSSHYRIPASQISPMQQSARFLDQQKVARLFIKRGYGIQVARKYFGPDVENNQYTNLCTTVIRESWRKVEDMVGMVRKISPMNVNQFKIIKTPLTNCIRWMDKQDITTFYMFIAIVYKIKQQYPLQEQAIRLYNSCIRKYEEMRTVTQYKVNQKGEKKRTHKPKVPKSVSSQTSQIKPELKTSKVKSKSKSKIKKLQNNQTDEQNYVNESQEVIQQVFQQVIQEEYVEPSLQKSYMQQSLSKSNVSISLIQQIKKKLKSTC